MVNDKTATEEIKEAFPPGGKKTFSRNYSGPPPNKMYKQNHGTSGYNWSQEP